MNEIKAKLAHLKKIKDRDRLTRLTGQTELASSQTLWISIAIVSLPFLLLLTVEIAARCLGPARASLSLPWRVYDAPYAPLSEFRWTGDLTRLAPLPIFNVPVEKGPYPLRYSHRITDEWGFPNRPANHPPQPIDREHEIILTGTSYMAEGSTVDKTFASQLSRFLETPVYNASWPSGTPTRAAIKVLTDASFCKGNQKLVILGIVQRYLYDWAFNEVFDDLADDGSVLKIPSENLPSPTIQDYIDWRVQVEKYLMATSVIREWAVKAARPLPPVVFQLGNDTPVRLSWLKTPDNAPMLFYSGDIVSTYLDYNCESRNGPRIADAIERIHKRCQTIGTKFLVIIVPDKYEIYRNHVTPRQFPQRYPEPKEQIAHPSQRAPEVLVEELNARGIDALDLYEPLYHAQLANEFQELLYWVNDTHWSDKGIEIAAEYVSRYIKEKYSN